MKKWSLALISLVIVCSMAVNLTGCTTKVQAAELSKDVKANAVAGKAADDTFCKAQMELALKLFQSAAQENETGNVLISPLSVQLALAMTANGANGKTLAEMENLLGCGIPLATLNEYLHFYANSLPSTKKCKLEIANSIWLREGLQVEKDFLQRNADYYGAQVFKSPFDALTIKDVNSWVEEYTDGMIDSVLDQINPNTILFLVNAVVFDGQWEVAYKDADVSAGQFFNAAGEKKPAEMMHSQESIYLDDGQATGFIKAYDGGKYSFAALLPNEGVDIGQYIAGLTGEGLQKTLSSAKNRSLTAVMPKFSYEYSLEMNELLAVLGMPTAFDESAADFSKMATGTKGNIYIGEVLHKTYISVDQNGTKAAGSTKVEMNTKGEASPSLTVSLERPFVYMIIDNTTNLPVFIGAVMDI